MIVLNKDSMLIRWYIFLKFVSHLNFNFFQSFFQKKVPQIGGGANSTAQQQAPIGVVPQNVHQAPENVGN